MADPLLHRHVKVRQGAYLPHWTLDGTSYHVVFRLADSLPVAVVSQLRAERTALVEAVTRLGLGSKELNSRLHRHFSERMESCLDDGLGSCWLARDYVAALVADAWRHFDGIRYRLHAWCIMPNHTHVIVQPDSNHKLSAILKSWKGYSAREANRILSRTGEFWQPEYYDHLIRDEADMAATIRYIMENPGNARLINWRWVWSAASSFSRVGRPVAQERPKRTPLRPPRKGKRPPPFRGAAVVFSLRYLQRMATSASSP